MDKSKKSKIKRSKISAHKGGRNMYILARVTKEEKELINKVRKNLSFADYIVAKAKVDFDELAHAF